MSARSPGIADSEQDPAVPARGRRVSPWAVAALATGFIFARATPELAPEVGFTLAALALLIALLGRGLTCRIALLAAIAAGSAAWFAVSVHQRPADDLWWRLDHSPLAEPSLLRVGGLIETNPEERGGPGRPWPAAITPRSVAFDLSLRELHTGQTTASVSGRLRVRLDSTLDALPPHVRAGAFIVATGRIIPARPPLNPGQPPRDLLAAQNRSAGVLILTSIDLIHPAEPRTRMDAALSWVIRTRAHIHAAVSRSLDDPDGSPRPGASLLRAMLLGERDTALEPVESVFRRVGLVHLVAISGFNLAALVWITLLLVRLTGDWGRLESAIGSLALATYLFILPGEASIQRAGLTLLAFTLSESLGRRYDRVNLLGWCAFFLLLSRPMDLWSLGFQLSFGVVAALLLLANRVHDRLWGLTIRGLVPTPRQRTLWWTAGAWLLSIVKAQISATLLAWAVAAPLIAHHTGLFSPLAPITSLLVLPLTVVLLILGYAAMLIGLIAPPAADVMSALLTWLGDLTIAIVSRVDEWPGASFYLPRLSAAWVLAATVAAVYMLGWGRFRSAHTLLIALVVAGWTSLNFFAASRPSDRSALRLDALSMGDGDCLFVRTTGRDSAMLINCGTGGENPGADDLFRAIRELGGWRIPTVLITNPAVRSWSLLPELVDILGVRTVLIPESLVSSALIDPSSSHARLLRLLREKQCTVRVLTAGDRFAVGLGECALIGNSDDPADELIAHLRVPMPQGTRSVLLAGASDYSRLTRQSPLTHADILQLPHVLRAADKPGEAIAAVAPLTLLYSGSRADTRVLINRLGSRREHMLDTASGAISVSLTPDGRIRSLRPTR